MTNNRWARRVLVTLSCLAAAAGSAAGSAAGQTARWQPSPGHHQIPIWPGPAPDSQPVAGPEQTATESHDLVAGRPWTYLSDVSRPTMTVYPAQGRNTGVAVVVFPGGGYRILAIDLEGTEVCDWLTSRGITCILLKYRVPHSGPYGRERDLNPNPQPALEDAQRTLGLVRLHAAEWHIDPGKVGVLGFSAGGHLVAAISNRFQKRLYAPVDAADRESCRPDFAVALYPGHLWTGTAGQLGLNPNIRVTRETPPTFLVQAETDTTDDVNQSLAYYIALKGAHVPTEMHLYADGGHAFGLRRTKDPITEWPGLVEKWLRTIGMIEE